MINPERPILGIPEMDEQHKYLYFLFDRVEDSPAVTDRPTMATLLKEIEGYLLFHFKCEEHLIRLYGAPDFAGHQTEHERAGAQLMGYLEDFETGSLIPARLRGFLSSWLAEHSLLCDMIYADFIRKKRSRKS